MKIQSKLSIFIAIATAMITFARLGGAPTAEPTPVHEATAAPTQATVQNEGKLEIASTHSYVDSFNDYNVAGEIVNNTNHTVENVTLSLAIKDETGASLLKDDNDNPVDQIDIQPYVTVLAPGATAPSITTSRLMRSNQQISKSPSRTMTRPLHRRPSRLIFKMCKQPLPAMMSSSPAK